MGLKDIKAGKYIGQISSIKHPNGQDVTGKVVVSKKGTQGIQIVFQFDRGEGHIEKLMWTGWLGQDSMERTFETLARLGFNDNTTIIDTPAQNGNPPVREQFLLTKDFINSQDVELVIELETAMASDGITPKLDPQTQQPLVYPRIQWVNDPNGGGKFGFLKSEQGAQLTGINLKQEMMIARQKLGMKSGANASGQPQAKPATQPLRNHAPGASNPAPVNADRDGSRAESRNESYQEFPEDNEPSFGGEGSPF